MYGGLRRRYDFKGGMAYLLPFTAVLVTPVRLIMGDIGLLQGLISLVMILILMLLEFLSR